MFYNIPIILGYSAITVVLLTLLYSTQFRWLALLIPSIICYFIISEEFIWVLIAFSLVIYLGGLYLNNKNVRSKYMYWLIISLALTPLLIYKLNDVVNYLVLNSFKNIGAFNLNNIYSVVGLSFFTFNGISYLVDIRKGYIKPEKNYCLVLLYLSYFPNIFAGPLHRAKFLLPQFKTSISLSSFNFSSGFRLILWGIFKKYVIAQSLKSIPDAIIDHPNDYYGFYMLLGGFAFFLYIYADYTSYVDISQGISQFFGITLKTNFNDRVYASTSRKQFWDGWNITLNQWFRDYFFFSICKKTRKQWQLNSVVLLTFILIGIWHGATVSFIIWGFLNGSWILIEKTLQPKFIFSNSQLRNYLGLIYHLTFSSFIALIFRSNNLKETFTSLLNFSEKSIVTFSVPKRIIVAFIVMDFIYRKSKNKRIDEYIGEQKTQWRWLFYLIITACIIYWGYPPAEFYYFKF